MKADTRSVGPSFADTIGLPGTGHTFLCIFGKRYSCEVLGLCIVRLSLTFSLISPLTLMASNCSMTFELCVSVIS